MMWKIKKESSQDTKESNPPDQKKRTNQTWMMKIGAQIRREPGATSHFHQQLHPIKTERGTENSYEQKKNNGRTTSYICKVGDEDYPCNSKRTVFQSMIKHIQDDH